ncbi:phage major capsid protein [Aureimonas sp. N4]|uniref:phage major capsid protein n=1 Tax=Aureimonas sp. N4 TaxID=1638165 RepID=UPI0009ECA598|nr:phage major capsid protein [Aureimonas sp. N4]
MRPEISTRGLAALSAHLHSRPAAVCIPPRAAPDPVKMSVELLEAFEAFKGTVDKRFGNFQASLDGMTERAAAFHLGGGIMPDTGALGPAPDPAYTQSFIAYARSGMDQMQLQVANREGERQRINAAMSAGVNEAGGYLAPSEWDRQVRKAQRAASPFRQIANVVETSVRAYSTIWNSGAWGSGWVGETAPRPETATAALKPITFPHGEIYAFPMVSQQLVDDADFKLEEWFTAELGSEFERQEGIAFIAGDGSNKPRGFLTYVAGGVSENEHPGGPIATTPSGNASAVTPDALIKMVYALRSPYRQGATWLMNSNSASAISQFKDAGGNYLWRPSIIEGQPPTLLGYPVTIDENMPSIAANTLPIAFGNFRLGYVINDRTGIRILRDPFTVKPYVGFYTTKRVGGGVMDPNAILVMKVSAS